MNRAQNALKMQMQTQMDKKVRLIPQLLGEAFYWAQPNKSNSLAAKRPMNAKIDILGQF